MEHRRTPVRTDTLRNAVGGAEDVDPETCVSRLSEVQAYFEAGLDRLRTACDGGQPVRLAAESRRALCVADRGMVGWGGVFAHVGVEDDGVRRVVRECHRREAATMGVEDDADLFVIRKPDLG